MLKNGNSGNPDFTIEMLGTPTCDSPLINVFADVNAPEPRFIDESEKIIFDAGLQTVKEFAGKGDTPPSMELSGPRRKIYFHPLHTRVAVVTAGGLCPGLNNVVRALYLELFHQYGVRDVFGIRFGYQGLVPRVGMPPIEITPRVVENIHREGGSFLGSSRGPQDPAEMVDFLERERINILFVIGGDGTQRGALAIAGEIEKRNRKIAVVGIPKTIDNDIAYVERSFGFETAVSIADQVLRAGHEEARGAHNGVAVVKLMGRDSGFIAAMAAIANGDANFVFIPEVSFDLDGPRGFFAALEKRLEERRHALVVVAEGAGRDLMEASHQQRRVDASGNVKIGDIGVFLRDRIVERFKTGWCSATVKYIDPSYIIRSAPANTNDCIFCAQLAHNAVHAAMSGRTKMVIGLWNNYFIHVPMSLVISERKYIDPAGPEWLGVLEATGQPPSMKN